MLQKLKSVAGDINRLRVILVVFFEEGFDFLIEEVRLLYLLPFKARFYRFFRRHGYRRVSGRQKSNILPERLRHALERLGPTFVKFGQLLSLRPDLLPAEYIQELQKLQTKAGTFPFSEVRRIIKEDFGREIEAIFKSFEEKPFAAASLAQVHKARLKDNTEVAVKVQRPYVRETIQEDIHILFFLASLAEKYVREINYIQPVQIVKEFSEWTMRELDFSVEASNAERFRQYFGNDARYYFPVIYWDFSGKRVLTMERVRGVNLSDRGGIKRIGDDPRILALNGLELALRQLLVHGFFQADPHPGNFLALPDNVLCVYDFGMVGYLDRHLRDKLAAVFMSFIEKNVDHTVEKMLDLAPEYSLAAREEFVQKASPILSGWFYSKGSKQSMSKIFYDLVVEGVRSGLYFPKNLVLCSRTLLVMEATGVKLYPEFQLYKEITPLFEKVLREKFDPQRLLKDAEMGIVEYLGILQQLPENTLKLIEKIEKGQIDVRIDKSEIMAIKDEMERVNAIRLLSIIIVALLVSSAIVLRLEQQTLLFGFSVAKIELVLAVVAAIWLFVMMKRK
ncbi:MAG: AarF/ABC1/UbiB kinase family protein [Candidatus Omnitrophica bacterium]|nr:AarF/ABC1/UbiB kinase family protein [Candidatus Omnitrophota bacterium]